MQFFRPRARGGGCGRIRAMPTIRSSLSGDASIASPDAVFLDRVRAVTTLLEEIVTDRALLAQLPADDRQRLLQAAGHVYAPDAAARRQLVRAGARRRK